MKILSCISILSWVCVNKAIGMIVYDALKMKPLMDKLENIFDEKEGLQRDITCSGLNFLSCYELLLITYGENIQNKIVEVIEKQAVQNLDDYNKSVVSLLDLVISSDKYTENGTVDNDQKDIVTGTIDVISFKDSNMSCVIDFLKMFQKNVNNMLADYFFYADDKMLPRAQNMTELKKIINTHFKNWIDNHPSNNEQELKNDIIPTQKKSIINYSTPFCDVGHIPMMKENLWIWKKLQNSYLLSQKMFNSKSLMGWQDLKVL